MESEDTMSEEGKGREAEKRNSPSPWKKLPSAAKKDEAVSPWKQRSPLPEKEDSGFQEETNVTPTEEAASPWKQRSPLPEKKDSGFQEETNVTPTEEKQDPPEEEILVPVEEEEDSTDVTAEWSRRRRNRAVAIQFIYAWSINKPDDLPDSLDEFFIERELNRDEYVFAEELIHGAVSKMDEIDALVQETAENWEFDRIARIDLALLRLGIHELLHRPDVPPVVVINEIIDLGKAFSEEKSKRFLNGVLDKVLAQLDRPARESSM